MHGIDCSHASDRDKLVMIGRILADAFDLADARRRIDERGITFPMWTRDEIDAPFAAGRIGGVRRLFPWGVE